MISQAAGEALADLAVWVVGARLADLPHDPPVPRHPQLGEVAASFVTLQRRGQLRGCIGTLEASQPLYLDVAANAVRAMRDPRLPAVTGQDWPELEVSVSVLSQPVPMAAVGFEAIVAELRVGVDGLILTDGRRRATFLPVVWTKLADPRRFVTALLAKGGWAVSETAGLRAMRYSAAEFDASAARPGLDRTYPSDPAGLAAGGSTGSVAPRSAEGSTGSVAPRSADRPSGSDKPLPGAPADLP